jgi:hypothetical protein
VVSGARWIPTWAAVALCLAGLVLAGLLERRSMERANRLHRGGEPQTAARAYAELQPERERAGDALHFNFGTALLALGSPATAAELGRASESEETELRVWALYNLGLWHLRRARDVVSADSVRTYAMASADANKEALRIQPGRTDARWNLALAQRMLDSINADDGRAGTESVDGTNDADEQVLSEELREFEDPSDVNDAPRQGSDEALAQAEDASGLTPLEVDAILVTDPDRSVIVRKLLTYQGRMRPRPFGRPAVPRW